MDVIGDLCPWVAFILDIGNQLKGIINKKTSTTETFVHHNVQGIVQKQHFLSWSLL